MCNSSLTTFEFIDLIAIRLRCIFTRLLMWSSTFIVKYIRCRVGHICAVMGKNGVKKKCLLLRKKTCLSKKKLCKCSDPIFQVSETLHGWFAIQRNQTCFCRIDRGRDNPPNRPLMSLGRPAHASQQMACPSCWPVFHGGFTFVRVSVNELAPESSSFKINLQNISWRELLGSHTQYDKLFMAVMLLGTCMWHEFSLSVCLYAGAPYLHLPPWPAALHCKISSLGLVWCGFFFEYAVPCSWKQPSLSVWSKKMGPYVWR